MIPYQPYINASTIPHSAIIGNLIYITIDHWVNISSSFCLLGLSSCDHSLIPRKLYFFDIYHCRLCSAYSVLITDNLSINFIQLLLL